MIVKKGVLIQILQHTVKSKFSQSKRFGEKIYIILNARKGINGQACLSHINHHLSII